MTPSANVLLIALLTASLLWPAEDAVNGAGLHWVVLWTLAGLWLSVGKIRHGGVPAGTGRWGLASVGWGLIVLGQWISTLIVFRSGGDRRAALNLSFEWLGLLVAAAMWQTGIPCLLRRSQMAAVVVAVMVGIAGYGIWQHQRLYAEQASWYQSLRSRLDAARSGADSDPAALLRSTQIVQELQQNGIPLDGTNRILWEQRLLNSSEPTGTFALANTLSGIIVVALIFLAGGLAAGGADWKKTGLLPLAGTGLSVVVLAYCLVLTKSRTAWIGGSIGLLWLIISRSRRFPDAMRRIRMLVLGGGVAAGIAVAAGVATGGLDREVILESPRSLQFRLFYWMGTAGILGESPWAGAGPGNFRQSYLRHKVDESSEEIRDPHNFLLEAWTSGGIISLAGILLCAGALLRSLITPGRSDSGGSRETNSAPRRPVRTSVRILAGGVGLGFGLHFLWSWGNGGEFDTDLARWVGIPGLTFAVLLCRLDRVIVLDRMTAQAGVTALSLHLCGAGGFQMPIVMLLWVWLLLTAADDRAGTDGRSLSERGAGNRSENSSHSETGKITQSVRPSVRPWLGGAICLFGLLAVGYRGLVPVIGSQRAVSRGMDFQRRGDAGAAAAAFARAAVLDEWSPIPRQRRAELETYMLRSRMIRDAARRIAGVGPGSSGRGTERTTAIGESAGRAADDRQHGLEGQLQQALKACDEWIQADPRNPGALRLRAECRRIGYEFLRDPHLILLAGADQQRVTWMYPSSVDDWWRLFEISRAAAEVLGPSEQPTAERNAAVRALELDVSNHLWGHSDRYLTGEQVGILRQAAGKY